MRTLNLSRTHRSTRPRSVAKVGTLPRETSSMSPRWGKSGESSIPHPLLAHHDPVGIPSHPLPRELKPWAQVARAGVGFNRQANSAPLRERVAQGAGRSEIPRVAPFQEDDGHL